MKSTHFTTSFTVTSPSRIDSSELLILFTLHHSRCFDLKISCSLLVQYRPAWKQVEELYIAYIFLLKPKKLLEISDTAAEFNQIRVQSNSFVGFPYRWEPITTDPEAKGGIRFRNEVASIKKMFSDREKD